MNDSLIILPGEPDAVVSRKVAAARKVRKSDGASPETLQSEYETALRERRFGDAARIKNQVNAAKAASKAVCG